MNQQALLQSYYGIKEWKVPENYLCPPIPSRADYVHHVSDLISSSSDGKYQVNSPYEGDHFILEFPLLSLLTIDYLKIHHSSALSVKYVMTLY